MLLGLNPYKLSKKEKHNKTPCSLQFNLSIAPYHEIASHLRSCNHLMICQDIFTSSFAKFRCHLGFCSLSACPWIKHELSRPVFSRNQKRLMTKHHFCLSAGHRRTSQSKCQDLSWSFPPHWTSISVRNCLNFARGQFIPISNPCIKLNIVLYI